MNGESGTVTASWSAPSDRFSRVEAVLYTGNQLSSLEEVATAQLDSSGGFHFAQVPSGGYWLSLRTVDEAQSYWGNDYVSVELRAGEQFEAHPGALRIVLGSR